MIAFVEFGAANRVTTDDEKAVMTLVTAMKFVDIGAICRNSLRLRMMLCR